MLDAGNQAAPWIDCTATHHTAGFLMTCVVTCRLIGLDLGQTLVKGPGRPDTFGVT